MVKKTKPEIETHDLPEMKIKPVPEQVSIVDASITESPVAVLGARHAKFQEDVQKLAKKHGIDIALLPDRMLEGTWMAHVRAGDQSSARTALTKVITDENLRKHSYEQAVHALNIITNGDITPETAGGLVFTQTDLVRASTLSHKQAAELLDTLYQMGRIGWVDRKKRAFVFVFDAEEAIDCVTEAVEKAANALHFYLTKCDALIDLQQKESNGAWSEDYCKERKARIRKDVTAALK